MLTLHGQVVNVFETPRGVNRETGEEYGGQWKVQILTENLLRNGQTRTELVDLTVEDPAPFQSLQGRSVRVPVGVYVVGRTPRFFHLRRADTPVESLDRSEQA